MWLGPTLPHGAVGPLSRYATAPPEGELFPIAHTPMVADVSRFWT